MGLRQGLRARIGGVRLGHWSLADHRDRLLFTAAAGFLLDLLYAFCHGALGVRDRSAWFLTLSIYYSLLGAVRFSAALCGRKGRPQPQVETFVARFSGVLLILLSLVLAGVSYLSLTCGVAPRRDTILMITIATYTFGKLGLAVRRALRWRGDPSRLLGVIRAVGYAELAASVFTMQRSMIASFGTGDDGGMEVLNRLSGGAVFLFVLLLGANILKRSNRKEPEHGQVKADKSQ